MSKKIGIAVSIIIAITAIVVCLAPTKTESYTEAVPLSYEVDGFAKMEQRDDAQFILGSVAWSKDPNEIREALNEAYRGVPTGYVVVQNTDSISGTFEVQLIFKTSKGQDTENFTSKLNLGELKKIRHQAVNIKTKEWSFNYKVIPEKKTVTKQKTLTLLQYMLDF